MSNIEHLSFEDLDTFLLAQNGKVVHQVWFGLMPSKKQAKKMYKDLKRCRDSWKIKNPDWCHIEWDKEMSLSLIKTFYPQHEELFKSYSYEIQRCDVIRYFALHRYGGLYADMDYFCNKSWSEVTHEYPKDLYLVQTPNRKGEYVSNSLMYSKQDHPFWKFLFNELEKNQKTPLYYTRHMIIMFTTGPGILNRTYSKYKIKYSLSYYPSDIFQPFGIGDDKLTLTGNDKIYSLHLGKGSWEGKDSKFYLFLFQEWKILLFIIVLFIICVTILYLSS